GTRVLGRARHDHGMATPVFVPGHFSCGQIWRPVLLKLGFYVIENSDRDSDIRDNSLAAIRASRHQHMAWLLAKEGHGQCGAEGLGPRLSRGTVEPRGHID